MLKKIAAVFVCALTFIFIFAGCTDDNNSAIVGEWEPTTASINGETIQFSELNSKNKEFRFTFESSGRCEILIAGTKNNGTYVFNETSVDIEYGGKTEKLLYDDGVLTLNFNYNNETTSFMFTKVTE